MDKTENKSTKSNVKAICITAVSAALIFVFTYTFKITFPSGYTHLGDCMIFLSLVILGRKRAALAAGTGACLADLIGGYAQWIIPSFIIKYIMVLIAGFVMQYVVKKSRIFGLLVGGLLGGIFQIAAYTAVKVVMIDSAYALTSLPRLAFQTAFGLAAAVVLVAVFDKTKLLSRLQKAAGTEVL